MIDIDNANITLGLFIGYSFVICWVFHFCVSIIKDQHKSMYNCCVSTYSNNVTKIAYHVLIITCCYYLRNYFWVFYNFEFPTVFRTFDPNIKNTVGTTIGYILYDTTYILFNCNKFNRNFNGLINNLSLMTFVIVSYYTKYATALIYLSYLFGIPIIWNTYKQNAKIVKEHKCVICARHIRDISQYNIDIDNTL